MECFLCWQPPSDPSTPFSDGLFLWDVIRIISIVAGILHLALTPVVIYFSAGAAQRLRFVLFAFLVLLVVTIQVEHMGDYPSWRTSMAMIVNVLSFVSLVIFMKFERLPSAQRKMISQRCKDKRPHA